MNKPENPPAFPRPIGIKQPDSRTAHEEQDGMTLRDYFAGQALQGMLANPEFVKASVRQKSSSEETQWWHAITAYQFADAMLKERCKN